MAPSRSAVDKLDSRLRRGSPTDADLALLEELRSFRQRQLDAVVALLRGHLGLEVTSRVKTTGTLVEKLRREQMRLSQMDDVAGARINVHGDRTDQDRVVTAILGLWPEAEIKDRRERPSHGYRAAHVIPKIEGWPVEIQVRTHRQDAIANLLERVADSWGRQLRYGGPPTDPEVQVLGQSRVAVVDAIRQLADLVAAWEASASHDIRSMSPLIDTLLTMAARDLDRALGR